MQESWAAKALSPGVDGAKHGSSGLGLPCIPIWAVLMSMRSEDSASPAPTTQWVTATLLRAPRDKFPDRGITQSLRIGAYNENSGVAANSGATMGKRGRSRGGEPCLVRALAVDYCLRVKGASLKQGAILSQSTHNNPSSPQDGDLLALGCRGSTRGTAGSPCGLPADSADFLL
jgi:hypothetical protein